MTNKHTQGPWKFRSEAWYFSQIDGADGSVVCCFDEDPNEHDARLMEASPDLLEAAQRVLSNKRGEDDWLILATHCHDLAAAIAKATGESQ